MPSSKSALRARSNGAVARRCGRRRPAPRPSRSSPCTAGRRRRVAGRRATRRCRRTRSRSSRCEAPGGQRQRDVARMAHPAVGPHVLAELAGRRRALEHGARTAAGPTPVIIRVVHIAPGPTPTLTMSAPASTRSRTPSAETTLPATTGTARVERRGPPRSASSIRSWCPWAVSTTRHVDARPPAARSAFAGDVAVDADGGGDPQPPGVVDGRRVERRAQRAGAGQHADQRAVGVDDRRQPVPAGGEQVEGLARVRRRAGSVSRSVDITWRTWVNRSTPAAVGLGDHADRPAVLDDDHGAVRALAEQRQRVADGVGRAERDRGVEDRVALLDPADHLARRRRAGCPAGAPRCRRGGPRSRPSGGRRPRSCWPPPAGSSYRCRRRWTGRRRSREATAERLRHHEDVVVGQVVRGGRAVEEPHPAIIPGSPGAPRRSRSSGRRIPADPGPATRPARAEVVARAARRRPRAR